MLTKYPLRVAFNPFVADIGNLLPSMVSGSVLVSVVLGLQTIGPTLLTALKTQDQFLSGLYSDVRGAADPDRHHDFRHAAGDA